MFLGSWPPHIWRLKAKKNSNSFCSSEGRNRSNPKKFSYSAKKVWLGFRGFRTCFWEVDHPIYDVWKQKNSNSYCSSEGRNRSNPKESSYSAKKVQIGFRGFRTCFWEVDHTMYDIWKQKKTQFLIAQQKEEIDWTQRSPAIRHKKFG